MNNTEFIERNIGLDETFIRVIKTPTHFKVSSTTELKAASLFMPASKNGILDGVSVDRAIYSTTLQTKLRAHAHFPRKPEDEVIPYAGLAFISVAKILNLNNLSMKQLMPSAAKDPSKVEQTLADINNLLAGFDTSCMADCPYCGVIATPMNESERVPPPTNVSISESGNPSHAEIFYMVRPARPADPLATIVQELARHMNRSAIIRLDPNPDSEDNAPSL
ncbi:hypothetical protein [Hymenobacter guriensis]|uniref:Uncharacterized protein n=1 Tax=Hymenobacter guriensis TaxID=2793065 RepID=A0ABS0L4M3_9BACT|nr:hypothetical protein [Hymenobacter guriensis]MBG8555042.1 hypothetical protein [Hymenobacter guriensis]